MMLMMSVSSNKNTQTHKHRGVDSELMAALILTLLNKHADCLCQEAEIQTHIHASLEEKVC